MTSDDEPKPRIPWRALPWAKARAIELNSLFVLRRQSRARIRDRRRKVWCGECGERIYSTDEWEDLITPNGYLLRHKQCPTERTHHD